MANANQVIVNGETILDLRSDTVTPETLQKGYTAHDKSGTKITGTLEASSVSVQPSKSVTITSNGIVSVTPDAPYDALKKVDVTVNVSGGGVETCTVAFSSNIPDTAVLYAYDKIFLTVFENNETTTKTVRLVNNTTVPNVVINSIGIVIYNDNPKSIDTTNATKIDIASHLSVGFTFTGNASITSTFEVGGGGGGGGA